MTPIATFVLIILGIGAGLFVTYAIIRLAIKHALRSHALWVQAGMPAKW